MRIFISYSSKHRDLCDRLQLALEADGRHEVFVDRSELKAGQPFDETLRKGLENCDLLLFLVSPESVAQGSYALAELSIARQRWRHPGGHVLPVKVAPTPKETIPPYLRAVTILEPHGDVVAETVAAVAAVKDTPRRGKLYAALAAALVLAGGLGFAGYSQLQSQRAKEVQAKAQAEAEAAQATALGASAQQMCELGDQALGWQRYEEATARYPERQALRVAQQDCGMRWLRDIHVRSGKETFTDIVNKMVPVLALGAASAGGQRGGDLRAHLGWADFLRIREGAIGLAPAAHYAKALALEPANVFAHAMWGHHKVVTHGAMADVKQHFSAALASGRETAFVRDLQFAALLYYQDPAGQIEAARAANDMRQRGEAIDAGQRDRLWTYVYYDGLLSRERREGFMAALRDADHPATFRWLYPEDQVRADRKRLWRFLLASLEDAAGNRAAALARYEALRDELKREASSGRMLDETVAALKRLR